MISPTRVALALALLLAARAAVAQEAAPKPSQKEIQKLILEGARAEAAKQTPYIEEYKVIPYPGGDVPEGTGVCTDLLVRAFRHAGYDLQKLLHEDRAAHAEAYPTEIWDRKTPDPNIDHRRCQNLSVWFKRFAQSLPTGLDADALGQWQGGDVIFFVHKGAEFPWRVAIVSDKTDGLGAPLVVDSFPPRTSETHSINQFGPIHSHFRLPDGGPALQPPKAKAKPKSEAAKPKAAGDSAKKGPGGS